MTLIEPFLAGEALRVDIDESEPIDGVLIWWLGQSGFLLKGKSGRVLLDPYLSDSLTRKYAGTDKPHTRMTRLAISPDMLHDISVVTSSHNHTDHLDAETLTAILAMNPSAELLIPEANRAFVAERLQRHLDWPTGISDGQSITLDDMTFHGIPAAHNEIDRDENGRCRYLGYIVQMDGVTIYHSGDTLRYTGMAELLQSFRIDVALLPINGNRPERRVAGNLFGDEAARLAGECGARLVVPCHYNMFEFNTEPIDLFVETCRQIDQPYQVLRCGERLEVRPAFPSSAL
jgi:L-ascorbate metabolism protein UlaG (beta-lactamase superfamily)